MFICIIVFVKVISIGEGIIAGFFYSIFALVFLVKLAQEDAASNTVLYVMNGMIIAISIVLAIGNACQMGLVDQVGTFKRRQQRKFDSSYHPQFVPRAGDFPDAELQYINNSEVNLLNQSDNFGKES